MNSADVESRSMIVVVRGRWGHGNSEFLASGWSRIWVQETSAADRSAMDTGQDSLIFEVSRG